MHYTVGFMHLTVGYMLYTVGFMHLTVGFFEKSYYFFTGKKVIKKRERKKERLSPFLYLLKILYISPLLPARIVLIIMICPSTTLKIIL